jgi:glycosyltransferase involved in cell wall biosynthesis
MTRSRTNICLNMIVKNEEKVLPRLIRSVKDYIDYYVIVDTGSTDGTIELIGREMSAYGIQGEVHERPWVNFGANRQEALELAIAADKTDWLLFIDADEELGVSDPQFFDKLAPGVSYNVQKHHGESRYSVPHLVNIRASRFRWEGPVHNLLRTIEGPRPVRARKDVWIVYHEYEGAKSHGVTPEQKYLRDAEVLERELEKDPSNARNQILLGQSYRDAGHPDKAVLAYRKRVSMDGWAEEKFIAQLELAKCLVRLGEPEHVVLSEFLSAYHLRPSRAEPLYELTRYFRERKSYAMASLFAKAGVQTRMPDDSLYVFQSIYTWRLLDELSVATFWLADYETSKSACETLLERANQGVKIPEGDLTRIRRNLVGAERKLGAP